MNENVIFVFPGLGAQCVGMGKDIFTDFAVARYTFQEISDAVGRDVAKICFNGTDADLRNTSNASLATLANSVSIANVVSAEIGQPLYNIAYAMAGHSMGEHSALHCAGAMDLGTAARALDVRGHAMEVAAPKNAGMVCIAGLPRAAVEESIALARPYGFASIANLNESNQFTISGENAALDIVLGEAASRGARIAKRMNMNIPAHSPLLKGAEDVIGKYFSDARLVAPRTKWFSDETGDLINNPVQIKDVLLRQVTNGVHWSDIMEKFPAHKISYAYELGPGRMLTGMIKRANIGCAATAVNNVAAVRNLLTQLDAIQGRGR